MSARGCLGLLVLLFLLALPAPLPGHAAEGASAPRSGQGRDGGAKDAGEDDILKGLKPLAGPAGVTLGGQGELDVPSGFLFFNDKDTRTLLERMENLTSGNELGLVAPPDLRWICVFVFDDSGYVEDAGDAADIDADALLESFREGVRQANKEKSSRGWASSEVLGWSIPPHYNNATKNLEWSLRFRSAGAEYDNYNVRILGREGVMKVIFAGDAENYETSLRQARGVIAGYAFASGKTHAEWKQGDKIAGYGLAALVAGGAAAAVAKSGLLGKFLKPVGLAALAVLAALGKVFRRKKRTNDRFEASAKDDSPDPRA
jgi:uncharacterized membrane-anchored protein